MAVPFKAKLLSVLLKLSSLMFLSHMRAAIVKPKAGPSSDAYSEEDWNTEVDENAQGADAYRYSKVYYHPSSITLHSTIITFGRLINAGSF